MPLFLRFHTESPSFGYWAAVVNDTQNFVKCFRFRPRENHGGRVELEFRLIPAEWGKKYTTEGCRALIAKGFSQFGVCRVFARTMASNFASIHILEIIGLKFKYHYSEPEVPEGNQAAVVDSLANPLPTGTESAGEITDGRHTIAL